MRTSKSSGAMRFLPETTRHHLLRRSVKVSQQWAEELEVHIATTEADLESAFHLLHDSYVEWGYMAKNPTGMRILRQHLMPQSSVIIAKWEGRVVGTVSVIGDNAFGLPIEKLTNLRGHRTRARRLAKSVALLSEGKAR